MVSKNQKIAVFLISVIIIVAAIGIVLSFTYNQSHQILRTGDVLYYDISGQYNNSQFSSNLTVHIEYADETALSYGAEGWAFPSIPNYGHDFKPYAGSLPFYCECIGNEKISTAIGTKCVKMLYRYLGDEVIILDVGLDSLIVYRWTVASSNGTYSYQYQLAETNSMKIPTADTHMRSAKIQVLNTPSPTPCPGFVFGGYPYNPSETGSFVFGSVSVSQGQNFHYIIGGDSTAMYVFSLSDFEEIENTIDFKCNSSLSKLPGHPGETNVTVDAGIYWFNVNYKGCNQTVNFGGEQVGGYFTPYFGLKGQDF